MWKKIFVASLLASVSSVLFLGGSDVSAATITSIPYESGQVITSTIGDADALDVEICIGKTGGYVSNAPFVVKVSTASKEFQKTINVVKDTSDSYDSCLNIGSDETFIVTDERTGDGYHDDVAFSISTPMGITGMVVEEEVQRFDVGSFAYSMKAYTLNLDRATFSDGSYLRVGEQIATHVDASAAILANGELNTGNIWPALQIGIDNLGVPVKRLEFVDTLPDGVDLESQYNKTPWNISSTRIPVYIYMDGTGNAYVYSEANKIYMNPVSNNLFRNDYRNYPVDIILSDKVDTSLVKRMERTFSVYGSSPSESVSIVLSNTFDTSNVTDMEGMFENQSASSLDFPDSFDTSDVTNMSSMFSGMKNLSHLKLPGSFDTSNVTNMDSMFAGMTNLSYLELPDTFEISPTTSVNDWARGVPADAVLCAADPIARSLWPGELCSSALMDGRSINQAIKRMVGDGTEQWPDVNTSIKSIQFVTTLPNTINSETFRKVNIALDGETPVYVYADNEDNIYIHVEHGRRLIFNENSSYMFNRMTGVTSFAFYDNIDTSQVKDMSGMFEKMSSLTSLVLPSSFSTVSIIDVGYMFNGMSSLETLRLPSTFYIDAIEAEPDRAVGVTDMFVGIPATATINRSALQHWWVEMAWPGVVVDE